MLSGWEGNRRSGVVLATRHRHQWVLHLWPQDLGEGDEHLPVLSSGVWLTLPLQLLETRCTGCRRHTVCMGCRWAAYMSGGISCSLFSKVKHTKLSLTNPANVALFNRTTILYVHFYYYNVFCYKTYD